MVQRVYAQGLSNSVEKPDFTYHTLPEYFAMAINLVLGVGIALTVIFLILGGIKYILSKGDAKAADEARQWLTNAVIGFIIVVGAFALRFLVLSLIGAENANIDVVNGVVDLT